jgi:hypothetical protein
MRLIAFHTILEPLVGRREFARHLPTADSVLKALSDAARSVAITLISHRALNFAAAELRLKRCRHLCLVLDDRLAAETGDVDAANARAALEQILRVLPRISKTLGGTIDIGEARSVFPARLPDLSKRSIHSLAAWINPSPHPDPVLVRHALRMAVLTMLAVAVYKGFSINRGYWMAFTIVVVLQPDFGSTRRRAGERMGGSIAGGLLGSALLWVCLFPEAPLRDRRFLRDADAGARGGGLGKAASRFRGHTHGIERGGGRGGAHLGARFLACVGRREIQCAPDGRDSRQQDFSEFHHRILERRELQFPGFAHGQAAR